nr:MULTISPECIES: hypothetical protein [Halobacillus]
MLLPHQLKGRNSLKKINCFRCRHFRTTWNPAFPRACSAYDFKSKEMPSQVVQHSSGTPCMKFEEKHRENTSPVQKKQSKIDYRL